MTDLLDDEALLDLRRRAKPTDPAAVLAEERGRREALAARTGRPDALAAPTGPSIPAEAPGVCGVCGTRAARDRCTACGKPACAADLWIMLRLCRTCASDRDVERGQRGARPEGRNWLEGPR